jgi:hypothetical protein
VCSLTYRGLKAFHAAIVLVGGSGECEVSLERFVGLRFLARQGKRHDEILIRRFRVRSDLDRTAGPFDRLIVLFQCEMGASLVGIPCRSKGIIRLSRIALSIFSRLVWNSPSRLITKPKCQ